MRRHPVSTRLNNSKHVFLSLEDETGISNIIVNPDLYEKYREVIKREKFLYVEGVLQNQANVISIRANRVLHGGYPVCRN